MPMSGFICHDDYLAKTAKLTDEEVGKLFRALMKYHATGETDVSGRESVAFDFIKDDIDRTEEAYKAKCEKNRENVRKRTYTTVYDRTQKEKEQYKEKEKEQLLDDDMAHEIQREQDKILNAAEDAGFKMSNDVRARLIALYADNGLDKVLEGLRSCVDHGATNLAYLKAVLKGEPRKEKPKVTAQAYGQRDYSNEQDEAMRRMLEMEVG